MTTTFNRPISESYWVIADQLLAGEYPGQFEDELTRKRLDALLEAGIDLFIDLTLPNELRHYDGILREEAKVYQVAATYRRFAIGDFGLPTPKQMNSILDTIDEGLQAGRKIYVHCWGGIGRTGTTVGCYLVRHGKSGAEALEQLSAWWRTVPKSQRHWRSPETNEQVNFVLAWAQHDQRASR